eukprot:g26228.t1
MRENLENFKTFHAMSNCSYNMVHVMHEGHDVVTVMHVYGRWTCLSGVPDAMSSMNVSSLMVALPDAARFLASVFPMQSPHHASKNSL